VSRIIISNIRIEIGEFEDINRMFKVEVDSRRIGEEIV